MEDGPRATAILAVAYPTSRAPATNQVQPVGGADPATDAYHPLEMPFVQDTQFAQQAGTAYGKYHSTFRSANQQVEAPLFERDRWLVAYVSFAPGVTGASVTDAWAGELQTYAKDHGFNGNLKIVYVSN